MTVANEEGVASPPFMTMSDARTIGPSENGGERTPAGETPLWDRSPLSREKVDENAGSGCVLKFNGVVSINK